MEASNLVKIDVRFQSPVIYLPIDLNCQKFWRLNLGKLYIKTHEECL